MGNIGSTPKSMLAVRKLEQWTTDTFMVIWYRLRGRAVAYNDPDKRDDKETIRNVTRNGQNKQ